jgi:AraC-like DNA-binding protein
MSDVFNGSNITAGAVPGGTATTETGFSISKTVLVSALCDQSLRQELQGVHAIRIAACLDYMRRHLDQPLQVKILCNIAGLSSSHFFHVFKRATGDTPLGFFIRTRMGKACELLGETTMTVKEIAALLGYEDRFYFSRLFKSVQGISPRGYRCTRVEQGLCSPSVALALRARHPRNFRESKRKETVRKNTNPQNP